MLLDDLEESTHKGYSGSILPPKGAVGMIGEASVKRVDESGIRPNV